MIRVKTTIEIEGTATQVAAIVAAVAKAQQKVGLASPFAAADAPDPGTVPGEDPPFGGGQ